MWRSGTSQLWAIPISRLRERGKAILTPDSLTVPERAGQVLANRMAPAIICIAPSTSQRLHLARRCVSFRGIDHSWGNYLAAAVLLSTFLFCASLEKGRGPLKALNSAPGPNSSTPNSNLDKPQHQPKNATQPSGQKTSVWQTTTFPPSPADQPVPPCCGCAFVTELCASF